jgi:hypothetical protein
MEYRDIIEKTIDLFHDRASQYGDMKETLERQAKIATLLLNKSITPYDIAMIMHSCKLGRLEGDRCNLDSYVDGINYFAFAGMFATANMLEREIAEMARNSVADVPADDGM